MWIALVVVAVICVAGIVAIRLALIGQRPRHEPEPEALDPSVAAREYPSPGEPTPTRSDGAPPPGSRPDRAAKRSGDDEH